MTKIKRYFSNTICSICFLKILLSISTAKSFPADKSFNKRIINGESAPFNSHQYALSIRGDDPDKKSSMFCGATLISDQWIVTAAHCFLGHSKRGVPFNNPNLWTVQLGSKYIDLHWNPPKKAKFNQNSAPKVNGPYIMRDDYFPWYGWFLGVKNEKLDLVEKNSVKSLSQPKAIKLYLIKVVQHPNYHENDIEWDIALAKLSEPVSWIAPIKLPNYWPWSPVIHNLNGHKPESYSNKLNNEFPKEGTECQMIGWGCKFMGGPAVEKASLARLKIVSHENCNKWYKEGAGLSKLNEFCAGYRNRGIGVCPGDSGSGLFCQKHGDWYLEGVTSATHRKYPENYPGIFSRVSFYVEWIQNVLYNDKLNY